MNWKVIHQIYNKKYLYGDDMKKVIIIILVLSFSIVGANIMYRASDIEFLSSYTDKTNV